MDLLVDGITVKRDHQIALDLSGKELHIQKGTVTLLLGECGAGKSTLLLAAAGLLPLFSGCVQTVTPPTESGLLCAEQLMGNCSIGYMGPQPEQQLFADSVLDELTYSLGWRTKRTLLAERLDRIRKVLREMGLPDTDDFLNRSPFSLSGGQKRRLALAGTLLLEPNWLLLDEPTSGLDAEGKDRLLPAIQSFRSPHIGGVLIASHDADYFLPIADRVLILQQGKLVFDGTPESIWRDPRHLWRAGLAVPESMQLANRLREAGFDLPGLGTSLQESADHLAQALLQKGPNRSLEKPVDSDMGLALIVNEPLLPLSRSEDAPTEKTTVQEIKPTRESRMKKFDPRAVWGFTMLLGLGVWFQREWSGIAIGLLITLTVIRVFQVPAKTMFRLSRYYAWLAIFSTILAGLTWKGGDIAFLGGRVGFSFMEAGETFRRLFQLYLVMWLGLLLPLTQSQLQLRSVLTQTLRPLGRMGFPVEAVSLGIMLLFRYIAVIGEEWKKYAQIAKTRRTGKRGSRWLKLQDIRPLMLPFFLSVLHMGEQTALALEARGYMGERQAAPSYAYRLSLKDGLLLIVGALGALLLFIYAQG
ncbi:ATP-binding cassette domain-containing protein [Gorillibacterium timonense]|uniref:ATP-binding cassette domain-containing protein n=1 Tax=Gorillibacterium timonense TaxID=1689269 RepID=UPI00071CAB56|nr:ATP-binding cassette domain-containing protein [Gorillibacterium timonense]